MAKTTIAGLLLVMLLVCEWAAEAAVCKDENGQCYGWGSCHYTG